MRHLIDPLDFSQEEIMNLLSLADRICADPAAYQNVAEHKKLATLFYEPSTRTRLSFEAATPMLTLVLGGAASGKSEYAESLVLKTTGPRYYLATMQVWDAECAARVEKHRRMRAAKQFETVECQIGRASCRERVFPLV